MSSFHKAVLIDQNLIGKHDLSGPRYTSYPTAPNFERATGSQTWHNAVQNSNTSDSPLSLYFHLPFCDTVCYYCACNKVITANKQRIERYIAALEKEIELQSQCISKDKTVTQIHFGGGTPTYFSDAQLERLFTKIKQHFNVQIDGTSDIGIEIHPHTVTPKRIEFIRNLGFNRLSVGIQDFNEKVQKAVNRFNSFEEVSELFNAIRLAKFKSVSVDLIYGLPYQTQQSFFDTTKKVIDLSPDRISLFNYAHLPHLFKTQKQIDAATLPAATTKLDIFSQSLKQLCAAGYRYIGMDHFAKPNDELARAQQEKRLHRNFQGYTTHGECDLLAFGVSAIAQISDHFFQNSKSIEDYQKALEGGTLPIERNLTLNSDDMIRGHTIKNLICHFELSFTTFKQETGEDFVEYFKNELEELKTFVKEGLVFVDNKGIYVTAKGRILVRRICMLFDKYLNTSQVLKVQHRKHRNSVFFENHLVFHVFR